MREKSAIYPGSFDPITNGRIDIIDRGRLVAFPRSCGTGVLIRGLRAISDFEYEFQMALMNRSLAPDIETFFMMPSVNYSFLSSNLVREGAELGGSVEGLVPEPVARKLGDKA